MKHLTWQCNKCGDVSTTLDIINPPPTTCYSCCISEKHDQEGHSNEEMDESTCRDIQTSPSEFYENSQCASQTGESSYEFGVR